MVNIGISAPKAPFLENFGIFKEKDAFWKHFILKIDDSGIQVRKFWEGTRPFVPPQIWYWGARAPLCPPSLRPCLEAQSKYKPPLLYHLVQKISIERIMNVREFCWDIREMSGNFESVYASTPWTCFRWTYQFWKFFPIDFFQGHSRFFEIWKLWVKWQQERRYTKTEA